MNEQQHTSPVYGAVSTVHSINYPLPAWPAAGARAIGRVPSGLLVGVHWRMRRALLNCVSSC